VRYTEHRPAEPLRHALECFWTFRAPAGDTRPHRVLPDGCMDVIFDLSSASAEAVGTMTRTLVVPPSAEPQDFLGVRFRPGWAPRLLGPAASELRDGQVALPDVWGRSGRELGERLAQRASLPERVGLLARELRARLARAPEAPPVARALDHVLAAGGLVRVDALADEVGLGARQLERAFATLVGVSPRTFARIVRFRAAVEELRRAPAEPRWAELAAGLGFYDQAHLIREFRAFTGLTPGAFAREEAMSRSSNPPAHARSMFARTKEARDEDPQADADPDRRRDRAGAGPLGAAGGPGADGERPPR
jgi:AraC-like DNA-binding protein